MTKYKTNKPIMVLEYIFVLEFLAMSADVYRCNIFLNIKFQASFLAEDFYSI